MELVRFILKLTAILACLLLLIGFYKPWIVLWWEDTQNRKKVIRLYGSIAIVSIVLYFLLELI
ncbi:MAG TPA: hypothetical protein VFW11_13840 [Cyclobacteriaceae bacterium]|nr:hypothetical protein [Cyclobacteriaceae bacterium]